MKNNEFSKLLIPLVAVLVIIESIVLVTNIQEKRDVGGKRVLTDSKTVESKTEAGWQKDAFDIIFGVDTKTMEVGKKYTVDMSLLSKDEYSLGSMELYVRFDPEAFEVSNINYDKKLVKPDVLRVSDKKGIVVANYYILDSEGLELDKAEHYSLIMFDVKPKKAGSYDFKISTGNDDGESVTMFLDNKTRKELPFISNNLSVNVVK